ncbi:MAG: hypothetical protein O3A46_00645 [Candidatus Poribacteria bacterium]|nr:hypothetical protein [Candidatus Poribacteria bacterium]
MLRKQERYRDEHWERWIAQVRRSPHRTILLPGFMGSELFDYRGDRTRWLDVGVRWDADDLEYDALSPSGSVDHNGQEILARSTVRAPVLTDPYARFLKDTGAGWFPYDWRESLPLEAKRLEAFLDALLRNDEKPITFVTHSMGGCLLLCLLQQTPRFDDAIERIIVCAPPFHGALKPIRVVEDGDGSPVDLFVRDSVLKRSGATFPGLFDLLVAPKGLWIEYLPSPSGNIPLLYPIRTSQDMYGVDAWTNRHRADMRPSLLRFAREFHVKRMASLRGVIGRFEKKMFVLVGLNGKTAYAAARSASYGWALHYTPKPPDGNVSNGDGTVLFQSSFLPDLPLSHYWAEIPEYGDNTHGKLVDLPNVITAINTLLSGGSLSGGPLTPYNGFIDRIDWRFERPDAPTPTQYEHLNYQERARMRSLVPKNQWTPALNPDGDALDYYVTREAAKRVAMGEDLVSVAQRAHLEPEFLERHVQAYLMPFLFG